MREYNVQLEIEGPVAMFARPDTGGTPTSYPLPTWTAAKGVLESIAFLKHGEAWFNPTQVSICKRVDARGGELQFQKFTMNYGGPLRKNDLFSKGILSGGSSMQLAATVLVNVCYRIEAQVMGTRITEYNPRHYLKNLFERRLRQGRCWSTPCLGWSEFVCTYWGSYRTKTLQDDDGKKIDNIVWKNYCEQLGKVFCDLTEIDTGLKLEIPSMLHRVWENPVQGGYSPQFAYGSKLIDGTLRFDIANLEAENA